VNARRVNAAAGVILAAQKTKQTAAGIAASLEAAGLLQSPESAAEAVSPWERAVAGLNALADADIAFWIEPDGHISGPFGDEHIVWDQKTSRWRLVHDEDDDVHPPHPAPCRVPDSPDCACPIPATRDLRPGAEAARRMIRDRQAEDSHDSPLHHDYTVSRDLPTGGAL